MDALSDVLRVAHLTGGVFLHAEFFAPWCIATRVGPEHCAPGLGPALGPASHLIPYHYIIEGEFQVRVDGEDGADLTVGPGEVVLVPRNDLHLMGSDLSLTPVLGSDIIQPPKDVGRPGSETVLAKLSELLFVEAVRRYAEALPEGQTGWLAGLREPYVARALALLHRDITRRWTVDDLCREVGLSRSALADRFIRLIGVPPMHYLANWRMQVATQKLRSTSASLAQIAEIVGYDSEAAFSRAFKKAFGAAPATWRRLNS